MKRSYTKVQELAAVVFERKANGETNRSIAENPGLNPEQIRNLVKRENRRNRRIAAG